MNANGLRQRYEAAHLRLETSNLQPFEVYPAGDEARMITWFPNILEAEAWLDGYLYALEHAEVIS